MVCVPTPAILALKFVPLTPGPLYIPPAGEPPLNAYVVELTHCAVRVPGKVTTGNALTVMVLVAVFVHPLALV